MGSKRQKVLFSALVLSEIELIHARLKGGMRCMYLLYVVVGGKKNMEPLLLLPEYSGILKMGKIVQ